MKTNPANSPTALLKSAVDCIVVASMAVVGLAVCWLPVNGWVVDPLLFSVSLAIDVGLVCPVVADRLVAGCAVSNRVSTAVAPAFVKGVTELFFV